MFGVLYAERLPVGQLEIGIVETRRDRTSHQCILAFRCGRRSEPASCLYNSLKAFSFFQVGAQHMDMQPAIVSDLIYV